MKNKIVFFGTVLILLFVFLIFYFQTNLFSIVDGEEFDILYDDSYCVNIEDCEDYFRDNGANTEQIEIMKISCEQNVCRARWTE